MLKCGDRGFPENNDSSTRKARKNQQALVLFRISATLTHGTKEPTEEGTSRGAGARSRAAQYKRVEGLGFTMELDGPRIRFETSADPTERAKAGKRIAAWADSAPAEINASIERIGSGLAFYPTMSLLAQLAGMTKLGDPETYKESETEHLDIELEYATWLLLQLPSPVSGSEWIDGHQLKALVDDLHNLVQTVLLYHSVAASKTSGTLDGLARRTRIHDIAIRSPGYQHHLIELLRALFGPFESELLATCGFTVDEAIAASRVIHEHMNEGIMSLVDEGREQRRLMPRILRTGTADDLVAIGLPEDVSRLLLALPRKKRKEEGGACGRLFDRKDMEQFSFSNGC